MSGLLLTGVGGLDQDYIVKNLIYYGLQSEVKIQFKCAYYLESH